jgi:hypothetical protein
MRAKVTGGDEKLTREALRVGNLFAEAAAKDHPSAEARAYVDGELMRDAAQVERHGDLLADALDKALAKFWLGYVTSAAVKLRCAQLKQEMGHAEASPVERLLIEHAVLCHARLGMIEHQHARATQGWQTDSAHIAFCAHWDRRLTLAQKRFDRAITTLARTRALLARADLARTQADRAQRHTPLRAVGTRAA